LNEVQHFFLFPSPLSTCLCTSAPGASFAYPQHSTDVPGRTRFQTAQLHDHLRPMSRSNGKCGMLHLQWRRQLRGGR
jgi:hypothetical protein